MAKAIDVELQAIINEGVLASELAYPQEDLMAKVASSIDGSGSTAEFAGMALATGRSMEDLEAWPERIAAVTADQIQKAAKIVLRPDRAVTGMILPTWSEYNRHQEP